MMKNLFKAHPERWLVAGMLVLAILTLAFQGGDGDVDPAHHPHPTYTRTPTATPTLTPPPALQACQVQEIFFNEQLYPPGTTITATVGAPLKVTLRLVDAQGAPLIGANVDATVTQTTTVQAAATIPPLVDQSGTYDGVYTPQNTGLYIFKFSVSDFTGTRFLPCSAEATVLVEPPSTATPTPTGSVTVTPTPTHTPTATPTTSPNATVRVNPSNLQTTLCSLSVTSNVVVENVSNLVSVQLELSYNPTFIQVIDPDRPRPPVQVRPLLPTDWFINDNRVDTTNGRIFFKATGGSRINGTSGLIAIDWRPQAVGSSPVSLTQVILTDSTGQTITRALQNGAVQVNFVPNCNTGTVALQGRTDPSGVIIVNSTGEQAPTDVDGYFAIIAEGRLNFNFPGYLSVQANLPEGMAINQPEAEATKLGLITLLAGDMNGDNVVDILDLANLAQRYQSTDPMADLNADGIVDILDLALVAGNYQRQGPLTVGQ